MYRFAGPARALVAAIMLAALAACTAQYRTHGFKPSEEELQQIVPGVDTRASVEDLVGVPAASGVLSDSGYYYIETEMRHFGLQRPKVTDRSIVAITFDQAGVVDNIVTYGLEDGNVIALNRRVTQTSDGDIGFIRKLFGNIGGLRASDFFGD